MDTIYAQASARGKAGVAVIRVSGPNAHDAGRCLTGTLPERRVAAIRVLRGPNGGILDEALVLVFDEGASFTGENVVEFHIHGGPAVSAAVLRALGDLDGLRLAEPGEFTRRALENDRLDLSQVEGLGDLIEAETEAQRRQAMKVYSGRLGDRVEAWRGLLIHAAAVITATIDFADEEVPEDVSSEVSDVLDQLQRELEAEIVGVSVAERMRSGFEIAIIGPPNVGKSTLLNWLAGREAAITSELAGTTRDVIEVHMDIGGLPVTFLDTAGLREGGDGIERIGIERSKGRAIQADLRVFLTSDGNTDESLAQADDIVVFGKADLNPQPDGVSGLTGEGVDALISRISGILERRAAGIGHAVRERHRISLRNAVTSIQAARLETMSGQNRVEIAAEEIRNAMKALDSVVGRTGVEDILDEIFSRFCIGK